MGARAAEGSVGTKRGGGSRAAAESGNRCRASDSDDRTEHRFPEGELQGSGSTRRRAAEQILRVNSN